MFNLFNLQFSSNVLRCNSFSFLTSYYVEHDLKKKKVTVEAHVLRKPICLTVQSACLCSDLHLVSHCIDTPQYLFKEKKYG